MKLGLLNNDYLQNTSESVLGCLQKLLWKTQLSDNLLYRWHMPDRIEKAAKSYGKLFDEMPYNDHLMRRLELNRKPVPTPPWTLC